MNVYKPLIILNVTHSITIMTDGCTNCPVKFLIEGRAELEEDQRIRRPVPDAGNCSFSCHWL